MAETARAGGQAPAGPTQLGARSWWAALKRTVRGFKRDSLGAWAAALTYFGILSIFPALLALVSVLGLLGTNAIQPLLTNLGGLAPGPARQILTSVLQNLQHTQSTAGVTFVIGLAVALWSASGYVAAFMRAANAVYEMPEGRPIWKTIPVQLAVTAVVVVLLALSVLAVVVTGSLAGEVGRLLGVGSAGVTVWGIAKWPALVVVVMLVLAILYWATPNVRQPGFRWLTPGSALAVLTWILASLAFAFYIANFGNYNKTYGTLAGAVIFLVWLYISNIAVLLGVEFDAELQRGRAIAGGHPPEAEPFVEPRDTRKFSDEDRRRQAS